MKTTLTYSFSVMFFFFSQSSKEALKAAAIFLPPVRSNWIVAMVDAWVTIWIQATAVPSSQGLVRNQSEINDNNYDKETVHLRFVLMHTGSLNQLWEMSSEFDTF